MIRKFSWLAVAVVWIFLHDLRAASPDPVVINVHDRGASGVYIQFAPPAAEFTIVHPPEGGVSAPALAIHGEGLTDDAGMPKLPAVARSVIVPPGCRAELEATVLKSQPVSVPEELTATFSPGFIRGNEEYAASGLYPPHPARFGAMQNFRGYQILPVIVHPYQFNLETGEIIRSERVDVTINFIPDRSVESHQTRALTRDTYDFLRGIALNPPHRDDNGERLPRGGYMIFYPSGFTGENFLGEVERLAAWKRAYGHRVEIVPPNRHNNQGSRVRDIILDAYRNWDPPVEYACIIGSFNLLTPPNGQAGDIHFGLLEGGGQDRISEVAVGRVSAHSADRAIVGLRRVMNYQYTPHQQDRNWFGIAGTLIDMVRGYDDAVMYNGRWVTAAERRAGFNDVREFVTGVDRGDPTQILNNWFSDRMNIVFVRGNLISYNFSNQPINPLYISSGGGHSEREWQGLWDGTGTPNQPSGPSVVTGTWHNPDTRSCDILMAGMARGLLVEKTSAGWARALAMTALGIGGGNFDYFTNWFSMYAEPAMKVWCGIPMRIDAEHREHLAPGMNLFQVTAFEADEEVEIADAFVSILSGGEVVAQGFTDPDGNCYLAIPPDLEGNVFLTISKTGHIPYRATLEVRPEQTWVGAHIVGVIEEEIADGEVNPGERVTLRVTAHNYGDADVAHNVRGVVGTANPWVTFINNHLDFGDIEPDDETDPEVPLIIELSLSAPAGTDLGLTVELTAEEQEPTIVRLPVEVVGARIALVNVVGSGIIGNDLEELDVVLKNNGTMQSPPMIVDIEPAGWAIQALRRRSQIPPLDPEEQSRLTGDLFQIVGNRVAVPGTIVPMLLLLRADAEDAPDTQRFQLQVGRPAQNTPQGPDSYGYICFDDTDEGWSSTPEYDWFEINPRDQNRDLDGQQLPGNRLANFAAEINLPFPFRFYGQEFQQATISENGFIALGDDLENLRNFHNFPLDMNVGGSFGMIAPMWDDLAPAGDDGNIFTAYDRDGDQFIIEWVNFRVANNNPQLTFQVILYDPEVYPTPTGDGLIKIQYRVFGDQNHPVRASFSTGICSFDGAAGLNYVFNNDYAPTSAPIGARRALLYTTQGEFGTGRIFGQVVDFATGAPVQALIYTNYGQVAFADAEGNFAIEDAWATAFNITATLQGYNDSTVVRVLDEGGEVEVNFALLHPEFRASTDRVFAALDTNIRWEVPFTIANSGNGPLTWEVTRNLFGEANAAPWVQRREFQVGINLEDNRIEGVAFVNQQFYLSGSNQGNPQIYVLNRAGELVRTIDQPVDIYRGMRDLTWDGRLLWGAIDSVVYGMNLGGEFVAQFISPVRPVTCLTWDPERELFWLSGITTDIFAVNADGDLFDELTLRRGDLRLYGLAYWIDAPDEFPLYVLHKHRELGTPIVLKFNPETGEFRDVAELRDDNSRTPGGAFITRDWDVYSWVYLWVSSSGNEDGGDRIEVHQMDARKDWFTLTVGEGWNRREARDGLINAGEAERFTLTLSSENLPDTLFEGELLFTHNSDSGRMHINVTLDVVGPVEPTPFSLVEPADGDTLETTELLFRWMNSVDANTGDTVTFEMSLTNGRDTLIFATSDSLFAVRLDTLFELADDMASRFGWWVRAISGADTVDCERPFIFLYLPDRVRAPESSLPREFTISSTHPNPFNERLTVRFGLPRAEWVKLELFDLTGRQVSVLRNGTTAAGWHTAVWSSAGMPSGVYLLRMEAGGAKLTRKVALVR